MQFSHIIPIEGRELNTSTHIFWEYRYAMSSDIPCIHIQKVKSEKYLAKETMPRGYIDFGQIYFEELSWNTRESRPETLCFTVDFLHQIW